MDMHRGHSTVPRPHNGRADRTGSSRAGSCRTPADAGLVFHEIDVARVRLIHDLRRDMEIGEDAIPLVLSLLDQVYELRSRMNAILRALSSQSEDVRVAVREALQPGVREP